MIGYGLGFGTMQYAFLYLAMRDGMPAGLASVVLLTLAGGLGWAIGNVCNRQARPDDAVRFTLWMSIVPPLPMLALSLLVEGPTADLRALTTLATPTGWLALAGVVAPFSLLVPVVGIAAAWLVLGERPTPTELLGAAAVIAGVLLGSRSGRAPDRPEEADVPAPDRAPDWSNP